MAAYMKHWRESASLILTSRCTRASTIGNITTNGKIDTTVKTILSRFDTDFDILMVKRSDSSRFMPNHYVFPGGVAENADFSEDWMKLFSKYLPELTSSWKRGGGGAPIFSRVRGNQFSNITSELAFRICAIRETFEECGILLACDQGASEELCNTSSYSHPVTLPQQTLNDWREKVYKDPAQFINMCISLQIMPEVWTLHEWSNWLTPPFGVSGAFERRFDSAVFITVVDSKPMSKPDTTEIESSLWAKPLEVMVDFRGSQLLLAGPQLYDLGHILNFTNLHSLHKYYTEKTNRVERTASLLYKFSDRSIFVKPGDDLYPSHPDPYLHGELELSSKETFTAMSKKYPTRNCILWIGDKRHPNKKPRLTVLYNCIQPDVHGNSIMEIQSLLFGTDLESLL